jgi:ABC-type Fe3+ transport system permease subunit
VKVSQTLSTLLSSFVTSFLIGLGVVAATVTLVLARVMVRKRRRINHTAAPHPDPSKGQTGDNVRVEF